MSRGVWLAVALWGFCGTAAMYAFIRAFLRQERDFPILHFAMVFPPLLAAAVTHVLLQDFGAMAFTFMAWIAGSSTAADRSRRV